ncbi:MAG: DUF4386 family protein [Chloroflexi bacterium]|nr:DUF4386 family protein [Chloroflexota bacterium]
MATTTAAFDQVAQTSESQWASLYTIGGSAALITVALILVDTGLSMVNPAGDNIPGVFSAAEWFGLFETDPLRSFRDLGVLNIFNAILGIPVFFALYVLHRGTQQAYAGLALMLMLFGGAVYISNNTVLPMWALSQDYAAATTEVERATLIAAGEAMLARGADFTPGSLVGFILSSVATLLMAFVLLRGRVFSSITAYAGLIGLTCLLIFTIWVTFAPSSFATAMLLALPGGLLALAWNILIARRLLQLGAQAR